MVIMAKKNFLTSGKLMEAVRKLDYMGQYRVCEAFFQMMVDGLINDYKDYLSSEQMIYLEAIRGSRLNLHFRSYEKSKGNCDYTDYFYEQIVLPEYRRLILLYYSLCKVSGIKVKKG